MTALSHDSQAWRILFLGSDMSGYGGIQRYSGWLALALSKVSNLSVLDLDLNGSQRRRFVALATGFVAILRRRPDLLVLGHVRMGPLGLIARLLGCPYVVVAYGVDIWGPRSRLIATTLRFARYVWPISEFTRDEVHQHYRPARTVEALGGSLSMRSEGASRSPDEVFSILTVSRLDDLCYKGIDTTLAVLGRLAKEYSVELRVVGTGPQEQSLRVLAGSSLLKDSVRLLGNLSEHDLAEEYGLADVVVQVSRYRSGVGPMGEGLGLTLLEGAAAGVPAIGATVGGSQDAVVEGRTGFLVSAGDEEQLYDRLRWLIRHPSEAAEMGRQAREWVAAVHSSEAFEARVRKAVVDAISFRADHKKLRR